MSNKLKKILLAFLITTSFQTANAMDRDNLGFGGNIYKYTIQPTVMPSKVAPVKDTKNNLGNPVLPDTHTFGSSPVYSSSTLSTAPAKSLTSPTTFGSPVNSGNDSIFGSGSFGSVPTSTGFSSSGSLFGPTSSPAPLVSSPLSSPMFGVTSTSGKGNAGNSTTNPSAFRNSSFGSVSSSTSSISNPSNFTASRTPAPLGSSYTYSGSTRFSNAPTFNPPAFNNNGLAFSSTPSPIFSDFNLTSSSYTPIATSPATSYSNPSYSSPPSLIPSFNSPSPTVFGTAAPLRSNPASYNNIPTFDSPAFGGGSSSSSYAPVWGPSISSPTSPAAFGTSYASGKGSEFNLRNTNDAPIVTHSYDFTRPTSYPPARFNSALLEAADKLYNKTLLKVDSNFQNMDSRTWEAFYKEFNRGGTASSVSIINWLVEVREEVNKKKDGDFDFKADAINERILDIFGGCWGIRKATSEDDVSGLKDILRGTIHLKLETNESRMKAIAQKWCGKISNRNALDDFENSHFVTLVTYYGVESSNYSHSHFAIREFETNLQTWLARNSNKDQLIARILEIVKREESDRNSYVVPRRTHTLPPVSGERFFGPRENMEIEHKINEDEKRWGRTTETTISYTSLPTPQAASRFFKDEFDQEVRRGLDNDFSPPQIIKFPKDENDSEGSEYSDDEHEEEDEEIDEEDGSAYGSAYGSDKE